jgi:hypothetical protein
MVLQLKLLKILNLKEEQILPLMDLLRKTLNNNYRKLDQNSGKIKRHLAVNNPS